MAVRLASMEMRSGSSGGNIGGAFVEGEEGETAEDYERLFGFRCEEADRADSVDR